MSSDKSTPLHSCQTDTTDEPTALHSCQVSQTNTDTPPTTLTQKALELGASAVQSFAPIKQIHAHLCALHAYAADPTRQIPVHHYCTHLNSEVHQCVLYDGADKHARLIGVEYLISRRLFDTLPAEEKPLWHSHQFEVASGMLQMPGLPEPLERPLMTEVSRMYGKIICTWQSDLHPLPIGPPQLMVSLTQPQQVDARQLAEQERQTGIKAEERRQQREGKFDLTEAKPAEVDVIERGGRIEVEVRVTKGGGVSGGGDVAAKQLAERKQG